MPPKKVVEEEVLGPWSLGRFSSNLKVRRRDDDEYPTCAIDQREKETKSATID
jgi:hypothetical protein